MTTYSTNTQIAQTSNATFQAWVNEIYTGLVTQCGITQTGDTGQMAVPCVTATPGAGNTAVGYYIFRFNDTLQATKPIFFRIDFGSSSAGAADPMMWLTVGTSTDGAGNITGLKTGVNATSWGQFAGADAVNHVSYWCYNATQGFVGCHTKNGVNANPGMMGWGFDIFRTVDNTGVPTADGCCILTNTSVTTTTLTSGTAQGGNMSFLNFNESTVLAGSSFPSPNYWCFVPMTLNNGFSTTKGTTSQIFPVFQYKGNATTPGFGITNALALATQQDIPLFSTITATILGGTSLTYVAIGAGYGYTAIGGAYTSGVGTGITILMLYQ
jgi:hypothetical protein